MRGDYFSPDVRELFDLLAKHGVRCLLVGGEAVIYHGYPRLTGDVDIWYEQTPGNVDALFSALLDFWNGTIPGLTAAGELLQAEVVVQFGRPPHRVDLLSAIDGVRFDQAWPRRVEESLLLPDGREIPVSVIGLTDLIVNKRASGRHKDLDDVEHLEPSLRHR